LAALGVAEQQDPALRGRARLRQEQRAAELDEPGRLDAGERLAVRPAHGVRGAGDLDERLALGVRARADVVGDLDRQPELVPAAERPPDRQRELLVAREAGERAGEL